MAATKETKKFIANRGLERHKRPLQNIVYKIDVHKELKPGTNLEEHAKYLFKDKGYLTLRWNYERHRNNYGGMVWGGFITPEYLKELLTEKQWSKFCQGHREFITQRRVDGKNIRKDGVPKIKK